MLLVAILAILSGQGSLLGMVRFAERYRQTLNELLGTEFAKSPSDSTFRLLLAQLDVPGFETLLRDWVTAQQGEVGVHATAHAGTWDRLEEADQIEIGCSRSALEH